MFVTLDVHFLIGGHDEDMMVTHNFSGKLLCSSLKAFTQFASKKVIINIIKKESRDYKRRGRNNPAQPHYTVKTEQ